MKKNQDKAHTQGAPFRRLMTTLAAVTGVAGIAIAGCNFFANFPDTNGCDGWACGFGCTKLIPGTYNSGCYTSTTHCCACEWWVGACRPPGINCGAGWVDANKVKIQLAICASPAVFPNPCVAIEDPPGGG
jgi:hypothetical protein